MGAEIAAHSGRLSVIPPSVHPSGSAYSYDRVPDDDLAVVDFAALGLTPVPKVTTRRRSAESRSHHEVPRAAAEVTVEAFNELFGRLGVSEGRGVRRDDRGEFFPCAFHADSVASLHILWASAIFYCQGCGRGGGLRALVHLVEPTRTFPSDDSPDLPGDRGTSGGADALVEHIASLADTFPAGVVNVTGDQLRDCRQQVLTYQCGAGHEFAPRNERGDPTPISCDASSGICPRCGPRRFLLDARAADRQLPDLVHVFRLVARTPGRGLFDYGLSARLTARLKVYRKSHGLTAGSSARSLHLAADGSAFVGHFILAVPSDESPSVVRDGAFDVSDLGECALEDWHRLQVAEQLAALSLLQTPAQLEAFYGAMHGQQQFRHFGTWYGRRSVDPQTGEVVAPKNGGGAGSARGAVVATQVFCPLHPGAQVRRSPTPARGSSLVRGDGGVLVPRGARDAPTATGLVGSSAGTSGGFWQ